MVVLRLNNCMVQMYSTEVPDLIRVLPTKSQMKVDTADPTGHALSLKVPLGIGSACLNVCVIKSY